MAFGIACFETGTAELNFSPRIFVHLDAGSYARDMMAETLCFESVSAQVRWVEELFDLRLYRCFNHEVENPAESVHRGFGFDVVVVVLEGVFLFEDLTFPSSVGEVKFDP